MGKTSHARKSSASLFASREPDSARRPRFGLRPSRLCAALLAPLFLLAALALAPPAGAQTPVDMVSNTGQLTDRSCDFGAVDCAQGFTTGSASSGYYVMTSAEISFGVASNANETPYTVGVWAADSDGLPTGAKALATLTNPSALVEGMNTFSVPSGTSIRLTAGTRYFLVIDLDQPDTARDGITISGTNSDNESGEAGWRIDNTSLDRTFNSSPWDSYNFALQIVIRGHTPPDAPGAPTVSAVTASGGQLSVSWTAPSETGTSAIADYDLRYYAGTSDPTDEADWIEPGETGGHDHVGTAVTATLTGLTASTSYRVQVRAANDAAGPWSPSGTATTAAPTAPDAPAAPTVSAVTASGGQLSVSWSAPSDDGGSAITDYDLRYYAGSADPVNEADWIEAGEKGGHDHTGTAVTATLTGLTAATNYRVQVRAVNAIGTGDWSASDGAATVAGTAPAAPDAPTVSGGATSGGLSVSWAAPSDDGGLAITDYDLRYYQGSADPSDEADWIEPHEPAGHDHSGTATSSSLSGLLSETAYRVQVRAVNTAAAGPWSASDGATTAAPPSTNRAPIAISYNSADQTCSVVTGGHFPGAAPSGTITSIVLALAPEAADFPSACSDPNAVARPSFHDRDGDTLSFTHRFTLPDNVRSMHASGANPMPIVLTQSGQTRLWGRFATAYKDTDIRGTVTAIDTHGASRSFTFIFQGEPLQDLNGAPQFAEQVVEHVVGLGAAMAPLVLPAASGGDVEVVGADATVTFPYVYAVDGLPAGLAFDPATRTVSGTPTETGSYTVTYTADDADGASAALNPALTTPADTASQTFTLDVRALAGNAGQGRSESGRLNAHDFAQPFTTGSAADGYTLTAVDINLKAAVAGHRSYVVSVRSDAAGRPGDSLGALTVPALSTAWQSARHPAPGGGIDLDAATAYWLVVKGATTLRNGDLIGLTHSDDEDGAPFAGWTIGNIGYQRAVATQEPWEAQSWSLAIALHGDAKVDPAAAAPEPDPPAAPAAPTVAAVSNTGGSLSVTWSAPPGTDSSAITDYDLRYYAGSSDPANDADWTGEGASLGVPDPGTSTSATITGVQAATAYQVQVRAADAGGESAWSASGSATTAAQTSGNRGPRLADHCNDVGGGIPAVLSRTVAYASDIHRSIQVTRGTTVCSDVRRHHLYDPDGDELTITIRGTSTDGGRSVLGLGEGLHLGSVGTRVWFVGIAERANTDLTVSLRIADPEGASVTTSVVFGVASFSGTSAPRLGPVGNRRFAANTAIRPFVLPAASGGDLTFTSTASALAGESATFDYHYTVTGLPPGLAFDPATRTVSGTPTGTGTFTVTYTADDADIEYSGKDSPSAADLADAARKTFTVTVGNETTPVIELVRVVSSPTLDTDADLLNDTYVRDDTILVDVEFSGPVEITGDRDVRLRLDVGEDDSDLGNSRRVLTEYSLVNGDRTLRYAYTVKDGNGEACTSATTTADCDTDGVWVQTAPAGDTVLFAPNDATVVSAATGAVVERTLAGLEQGPGAGDARARVDGTKTAADTGPRPLSAVVDGATLRVTFDRNLTVSVSADQAQAGLSKGSLAWYLSVKGAGEVGGDNRNAYQHPASVAVRGTELTLTLSDPALAGQTVALTYRLAVGGGLLKGADKVVAGNLVKGKAAPGFKELAVTNATGAAGPAPLRAWVTGTALQLVFDRALNESSLPPGSAFTVDTQDRNDKVGSIAGTGTVDVSGPEVTVRLAEAVKADERASVSYAKPDAAPLRGADAGADVEPFERFSVQTVEDVTPPAYQSAQVVQVQASPVSHKLVLYFDEALDPTSVPAPGDFNVAQHDGVDLLPKTVSSVVVAGHAVVLSVSGVDNNEGGVNTHYTPGTNPLRDRAGNPAAEFGGSTFGSPHSSAGKPALHSIKVDGARLKLAFENWNPQP